MISTALRTCGVLGALVFFPLLGVAKPAEIVVVFDEDSTTAAFYDAAGLTALGSSPAPAGGREAAALAGGAKLYLIGDREIRVLGRDYVLLDSIALAARVAVGPGVAALSPDQSQLLIAAEGGVLVIDVATDEVVGKLETGFDPDALIAAPGRARAWLLSRDSITVREIDLTTSSLLEEHRLAAPPEAWAISTNGAVWATSGGAIYRVDTLPPMPALASADSQPTEAMGRSPLDRLSTAADGSFQARFEGRWLYGGLDAPDSISELIHPIDGTPFSAEASALSTADGQSVIVADGARLVRFSPGQPEGAVSASLGFEPSAIALTAPQPSQDAPGSLLQAFGDNQVVTIGETFTLGVRAVSQSGVPQTGLTVVVSQVLPIGNAVLCGPSITSSAGTAVINCTASGIGEALTVQINVTDALGRSAPPFTINIALADIKNGLRNLTGSVLTVPQNSSFQFVLQAVENGLPQNALNLTVTATPGSPAVACPTLWVTDTNGLANVICHSGPAGAPFTSTVEAKDPAGRVETLTVTVVPQFTVGDGPHKVSGDLQTAPRIRTFPLPFVVNYLDGGLPRGNVQLAVRVSIPGVAFCPSFVLTDSRGQALFFCAAGNVFANTIVQVAVTDPEGRGLSSPFTVTIVPVDPATAEDVLLLSSNRLEAEVGQTLVNAIRVKAVDDELASVAGVPVYFFAGGSVVFNPVVAVTRANGEAEVSITPGCPARTEIAGIQLNSSGTPLSTLTLKILPGPPTIAAKTRGDGQSGSAGELLNQDALVVQVTDTCGTPISGIDVDWSVDPPDAAMLENIVPLTDGAGRSSALVRLGQRAGPFQVRALADGDLLAVFNLAVRQVPSQVAGVSGDGQSVAIGETSAEPLVVRVSDQDGGPIAETEVLFTTVEGSGEPLASIVRTNASGEASVFIRGGNLVGLLRVAATALTAPLASLSAAGNGPNQSGPSFVFNLQVVGRPAAVSPAGFVNGASFYRGWVPGSIGSIFGQGLMEDIDGLAHAGQAPFPTEFRGASVTVNGQPAPIIALFNANGVEQINLQVPFGLNAPGAATVIINNNGNETVATGVEILRAQPGIFEITDDSGRFAAALHADFRRITPADPARPGETILLYLTGLGQVSPTVGTNVPGPVPVSQPTLPAVVGIDHAGMVSLGAFYAPGLIGAYQINFTVGDRVPEGNRVLNVVSDGVSSQEALLPVGPPL